MMKHNYRQERNGDHFKDVQDVGYIDAGGETL